MSETEPEYYDGFLVRERPVETERERDLQCVNKSLIRQIKEKDAEIKGINEAYELLEKQVLMFKNCNGSLNTFLKELNAKIDQVQGENETLKEQVKNLTEANGFLFKLLGELTIASDKVSEQNNDLKDRNAKLREILVDTLKRN
jgi:ABC-type transporter Mla subunit MlaD